MANNIINYSIEISKAQEIQEIIREDGYNYSVKFDTVWKNNVQLKGLHIQGDTNVAPTIYYTDEDVLDLAKKVEAIIDKGIPEFKIVDLFNHAYLETNLFPALVSNNDFNRDYLAEKNIPYKYLAGSSSASDDGLLIILKIKVKDGTNPGEMASCTLSEAHLKQAEYTFADAFDQAIRNINDDINIVSMSQMMRDMLGAPWEDLGVDPIPEDDTIYVMTNFSRFQGANTILSNDALEMLAERLGTNDYYILPSSVHEVLAVRTIDDPYQEEKLKDMVTEVNATQVAPDERLCDGVFRYVNGQLTRVA